MNNVAKNQEHTPWRVPQWMLPLIKMLRLDLHRPATAQELEALINRSGSCPVNDPRGLDRERIWWQLRLLTRLRNALLQSGKCPLCGKREAA